MVTDTKPGGVQVSKQHSLGHYYNLYAKVCISGHPEALIMLKATRGSAPSHPVLTGDTPLKSSSSVCFSGESATKNSVFFQVKLCPPMRVDLILLHYTCNYHKIIIRETR